MSDARVALEREMDSDAGSDGTGARGHDRQLEATTSPSHRGRYRRLIVAWILNNFSDSALIFVLVLWVHEATGSNTAAAFVFAFQGIPALLAPIGGVMADHLPRAKLMAAANVIAALGVGVLLIGGAVSQLPVVYAVAFIYGCLGRLVAAANSGLVRDLLPDDDLPAAAGQFAAIDQGMLIVAPLAGVGLYSLVGGRAVVGVVMVGLVLSAALYVSIVTADSHSTSRIESIREEILAGFRFIQSTPPLGQVTLLISLSLGAAGMASAATVEAVDVGLERSTGFIGILSSVQGIGSIVGGLAASRVVGRLGERRLTGVGLGLLAVGLAPFVIPTLPSVLVGEFFAGVGVTWSVVGATVLRQRRTPGPLQGRVAAATGFLISGAVALATVIGAGLIGLVGFRIVFGIVVAVAALGAARLLLVWTAGIEDGADTPSTEGVSAK